MGVKAFITYDGINCAKTCADSPHCKAWCSRSAPPELPPPPKSWAPASRRCQPAHQPAGRRPWAWPLFKREHRGVSLTPEGQQLVTAVRESLSSIGEVAAKIRARRERQVLTVATDFGFATYGLCPAWPSWCRSGCAHRDQPEPVRHRGNPWRLQWPGCRFPEIVVPVCAPPSRASACRPAAAAAPRAPALAAVGGLVCRARPCAARVPGTT